MKIVTPVHADEVLYLCDADNTLVNYVLQYPCSLPSMFCRLQTTLFSDTEAYC